MLAFVMRLDSQSFDKTKLSNIEHGGGGGGGKN